MEDFHSIGCVYNDLKLDNICVGTSDQFDKLQDLKLIDFGLASAYVNASCVSSEPKKPEDHIEKTRANF